MKNKLKSVCVLIFVLAFCFSAPLSIYGKTQTELNDEYQKIQEQINKSQAQISSLEKEKDNKQEYIDSLMQKIDYSKDIIENLKSNNELLQNNIQDLETQIVSCENDINELNTEIKTEKEKFNNLYEDYCQRLRALYISGNTTYLELILCGNDISSFLTKAEMVKRVSMQDTELLNNLTNTLTKINTAQQELVDKKATLEKDKEQLTAEQSALKEKITEVQDREAELQKDVSECNRAIEEIDSSKAEILETVSTNEEQLQEIEDEIKQALENSSANNSSSNSSSDEDSSGDNSNKNDEDSSVNDDNLLSYPTTYRTISAGYPNYSNGSYHGGVDWPCPTGTPVRASASGVVVIAKKLTYSYGQYILIDHGNGLSTLYAHNSSLCVSVGEKVQKGQLISYSGSTGNSTGPHLHFEVRLNGTRVNPMNYLK